MPDATPPRPLTAPDVVGGLLADAAEARAELAEAAPELAAVAAERDTARADLAHAIEMQRADRAALQAHDDVLTAVRHELLAATGHPALGDLAVHVRDLVTERDTCRAHRERLNRELAASARAHNSLTAELAACRERNAAIAVQSGQYRDERDEARAVVCEIRDHLRDEGYLALLDLVSRGWLARAGLDAP